MTPLSTIKISSMALLPLLFVSCLHENDANTNDGAGEGRFAVSQITNYDISVARGGSSQSWSLQNGDMHVSICEENWSGETVSPTRGNAYGDRFDWEDKPNMALYISNENDEIKCADIAYNPVIGNIFPYYYNPPDLVPGFSNPDESKQEHINNSKFFWNEWSGLANMPTPANFYGYCPRPNNTLNDRNENYYTPISIIKREQARLGGTTLDYVFQPYQDDYNLFYHDVMCSVPEEAIGGACYGNRDKTETDNIQLRFKHMFSLLEIEIDKGTYQGKCQISGLKISGSKVYTNGTLDILHCTTTPTNSDGEIKRVFDPIEITSSSCFRTEMIVQPVTLGTGETEMTITCTIDGANYDCHLTNMSFEQNKKYKLKLRLSPSELLYLSVWDGASVTVGDETYTKGLNILTPKGIETFTVSPADANTQVKVFRNGELVLPKNDSTYTYEIQLDEGVKTAYNVVAYPKGNAWYIGGMAIHFDALWNDKYQKDNQQKITYWNDLSGHDNDGVLKSFVSGESGWNNGSKGLEFDGIDDIVTFPGNFGGSEYTLEFYINIPQDQPTGNGIYPYKRLLGEPLSQNDPFPCVYLVTGTKMGFWGQGVNIHYPTDFAYDQVAQYDFVYKDKQLRWYINGVPTDGVRNLTSDMEKQFLLSLGNRTQDNSRALKATYHSFIVYDRALEVDEILHNLSVNQSRFEAAGGK